MNKARNSAKASEQDTSQNLGCGSIVHALTILRHLSRTGGSQGVTAIARELDISPSSCFNILKTLVGQDVIEFSEADKTYSVGYGLLRIVRGSLTHNRILPLLTPGMRKLADRFSTAVGLWSVGRNSRPLLIWIAETEASIRIHLTVGQRLPALAGAVGRCIAAHRPPPPAEFSRLFAKLRLDQPMAEEQYLAEIEQARKRGYSIDAGTYMQGVTTVAAPILTAGSDAAFSCLSATMFTGQHPRKELATIGEELRILAARPAEAPEVLAIRGPA
jgi:DNA-binding IclR family transcriptional regulator